eukprot:TRINITY_DN861_c0_g1_i1.p1 TRINITY_DN861_c0_g1~~TRINITY_DN861_c0_g1_i1.p1  ORF type:complete len:406 (-),score=67.67 TRINITY_DN861_c0_g1_i1:511-1728(-)
MTKDRCVQKPLCLNTKSYGELLQEAATVHGGRFLPLLAGLLEHDPNRRPTAAEVKATVRTMAKGLSSSAQPHQHPHQHAQQQLARAAQALQVPEASLVEPWDVFRQADAEGKGLITLEQLKGALAMMNVEVSSRALMKTLGKGPDGLLDFSEFASWWLRRDQDWTPTVLAKVTDAQQSARACRVYNIPPSEYPKLQAAFNRADTDNSGDISTLGLWHVLRELSISVGADLDQLAAVVGPDWQERTFTFDEVLALSKEFVDWPTRTLRPLPRPPRHHAPTAAALPLLPEALPDAHRRPQPATRPPSGSLSPPVPPFPQAPGAPRRPLRSPNGTPLPRAVCPLWRGLGPCRPLNPAARGRPLSPSPKSIPRSRPLPDARTGWASGWRASAPPASGPRQRSSPWTPRG